MDRDIDAEAQEALAFPRRRSTHYDGTTATGPVTREAEHRAACADFLGRYDHHRPHADITGHVPAAGVTDLVEQHI